MNWREQHFHLRLTPVKQNPSLLQNENCPVKTFLAAEATISQMNIMESRFYLLITHIWELVAAFCYKLNTGQSVLSAYNMSLITHL